MYEIFNRTIDLSKVAAIHRKGDDTIIIFEKGGQIELHREERISDGWITYENYELMISRMVSEWKAHVAREQER